MPDFSQLLRKPIGDAKKPPALPGGDYPLVVERFETGESNQKKTPFVRIFFKIVGFPDDVDQADMEGIDLGKKSLRTDFYLTEDAIYRLKDFLVSCGVLEDGDTTKSLEEALREATGAECVGTVVQKINQSNNDTYADLVKVSGTAQ